MPTQKVLGSSLGQLEEDIGRQNESATVIVKTSEEKDADTRQQMAMLCFRAYFSGLILIIIGVPLFNFIAYANFDNKDIWLDLKDVLLTYQAVIGALIGAIAAYYFKTQLDKSNK